MSLGADPLSRARLLLDAGRLDEALAITGPLAARPDAPHRALALHATALKGAGRHGEALTFDRRAVAGFGGSGVAWHNLAATLGDLGRGAEAVEAMTRGMALGLDGALSWGVMARARAAAGDFQGAEAAYRETLARAPGRIETAVEFADFLWMLHGDLEAAQGVLADAERAGGLGGPLALARARLLQAAGRADAAHTAIREAAARSPDDPALVIAAAQAALDAGDLDEAQRWTAQAPPSLAGLPAFANLRVGLRLAQGRAAEALVLAKAALAATPDDQSVLGWAIVAARAAGDDGFARLVDYHRVVRTYDIATPEGWSDLPSYLGDLAAALERVHGFVQPPAAQSVREGSQTTFRLVGSAEPAIRAFFEAADAPIRAYMDAIRAGGGQSLDPLITRNTGRYAIQGAWSVRLRPGGFHTDHFHPEGWISSAFYVQTPDRALDTNDRQGWIRFGQPPLSTNPRMPAEHFVRPRPGRLVLFPSYMWHGTVPFTTDERRLTIAFDIVPA